MGIREMLEEIRADTLSNVNKRIEEAKAKANNLIVSRINELEKHYSEERVLFDGEISSLRKKLSGKLEMEIMREKQEKLSNLYRSFIDEIFLDVITEIKKDRSSYLDFISRIINSVEKDIKGKEVEVLLSFEDEKIFSEIKKRLKNVKKLSFTNITGGIIIKTEDTYIDASLDYIFTKLKPEILKIIVSELGD
ncbi:MAG: hypothetical protein ACP5QT_01445 [Brevinematia bacterium]